MQETYLELKDDGEIYYTTTYEPYNRCYSEKSIFCFGGWLSLELLRHLVMSAIFYSICKCSREWQIILVVAKQVLWWNYNSGFTYSKEALV